MRARAGRQAGCGRPRPRRCHPQLPPLPPARCPRPRPSRRLAAARPGWHADLRPASCAARPGGASVGARRAAAPRPGCWVWLQVGGGGGGRGVRGGGSCAVPCCAALSTPGGTAGHRRTQRNTLSWQDPPPLRPRVGRQRKTRTCRLVARTGSCCRRCRCCRLRCRGLRLQLGDLLVDQLLQVRLQRVASDLAKAGHAVPPAVDKGDQGGHPRLQEHGKA